VATFEQLKLKEEEEKRARD